LCGSIMSSKPVVFETPVDNDRFSFITIYRVVYEISNNKKNYDKLIIYLTLFLLQLCKGSPVCIW
jgi:hypothetical protein